MLRKTCLALLAVLVLAVPACKETKEAQEIIKDGTKTIVTQPDRTRMLTDLAAVKPAIQAFQAQNDRFPDSLDELNIKLNFPKDLTYDSGTGEVKSKTFPNL